MQEKTAKRARTARRSRRRLAAWLSFAALGVAMGAVWATGFASIGGATGTTNGSPAVTSGGASAPTDALAGVMAAGSPLTVNWTGRWGSAAATQFFKATLDSKPAAQTFN